MVCRAINIQWLWVDVLCIVQDDPVDKHQEILCMGNIYRHTTLTSVAATASGSEKGFLTREKGFLTSTFRRLPFQRLAYPCPNGRTGSIYLIKHLPGEGRVAIESRGWTMQERLLSTRLPFFTSARVDWVCKSSSLAQAIRIISI